ncbi:DSHCT (NUC185) domain [Carpediemonas membranifera]|uniref:DSHCT (NUC185) domain n=1 Tax=Carpediemonas membranifera TaxID=201153 RepID=A0A8J6C0J8_9EUKA|nr:DSHCT (NUC185) domain [Carpediemonas membranifera]|eukprot:KAG9396651.1 DSHCT (NUC185) domain [Carpediemonas membranifera]
MRSFVTTSKLMELIDWVLKRELNLETLLDDPMFRGTETEIPDAPVPTAKDVLESLSVVDFLGADNLRYNPDPEHTNTNPDGIMRRDGADQTMPYRVFKKGFLLNKQISCPDSDVQHDANVPAKTESAAFDQLMAGKLPKYGLDLNDGLDDVQLFDPATLDWGSEFESDGPDPTDEQVAEALFGAEDRPVTELEGVFEEKLVIPRITRPVSQFVVADNTPLDDYDVRVPDPAITYPFELDAFQKRAVLRLEQGENVLVSAHTSSGKCLGLNTPVTMADGSVRMVQDVVNGESVMGDDGTARTVTGVATGRMDMFSIKELNGDGHWACVPEDHEILTDRGFVDLDAYKGLVGSGEAVLVAGYDQETRELVFETPRALVENPEAHVQLVAMTAGDTGVDLACTRDHTLFVQHGGEQADEGFTKVSASTIVDDDTYHCIRQKANASAGARVDPEAAHAVISRLKSMLGLGTEDEVNAFLVLFGMWLHGGSVEHTAQPDGTSQLCVTFTAHDAARGPVRGCAAQLGLAECRIEGSLVSVRHGQWDAFFVHEQPAAVPSWAWQLRAAHLRCLIAGLVLASGGANRIQTSSTRFRDDLVRLCLMAGLSPLVGPGGSVSVDTRPDALAPTVDKGRGDITQVDFHGRTWCFTMPSGFVWVRRVHKDAAGVVASASRAILTGNCNGDHLCVIAISPKVERVEDGMVAVTTTPEKPHAVTMTVGVDDARDVIARHRPEFIVPARELDAVCRNVAPLAVRMRRAGTLPAVYPPTMTLDDAYHTGRGLPHATQLSVSDAWQSPQHRSAMVAGAVDAAGSLTVAVADPAVLDTFTRICRSLCISVRMRSGAVALRAGSAVIVPFLRTEALSDQAANSDPARATYAFTVTPTGFGDYFGFELSGNRRFLLGDLTVTHNTVVAEYAIALALRHRGKAIYTAPIKSLSNQKFREFKKTFKDVGILTGDTTFKPDASLTVMTTEVLRSLLYKGSTLIKDVEWVIFDECHYLNDAARGVVWEELIVLLPPTVRLVLLSATVPNAMEFGEWVGRTRDRPVYLVNTIKRQVPLEYSLYCGEIFTVVGGNGKFDTAVYSKANAAFKQREKLLASGAPVNDMVRWTGLMEKLRDQHYLPAIVFSFSRRKCEQIAADLRSIRFTTVTESDHIQARIGQLLAGVHGRDRAIPQAANLEDLLCRGIGIHHAGMLPFLKEAVEMLFSEGLIKVLLATETFAMGVNMPARTVVFNSIIKHDGSGARDLHPAEFIQMAGRAGRRGLDAVGHVFITLEARDRDIGMARLQHLLSGAPQRLESQFRLPYSSILNLLRAQGWAVRDILKRSFGEFRTMRDRGTLEKERDELEAELAVIEAAPACPVCGRGDDSAMSQFAQAREAAEVILADSIGPRLAELEGVNRGAVIVVADTDDTRCVALVLAKPDSLGDDVPCVTIRPPDDAGQTLTGFANLFMPQVDSRNLAECKAAVRMVPAPAVRGLTNKRVPTNEVPPYEISRATTTAARTALAPLLDDLTVVPLTSHKIRDLDWGLAVSELETIERELQASPTFGCPDFTACYTRHRDRLTDAARLGELRAVLSDDNLQTLPALESRLAVLRDLGYVDSRHAVTPKGRAACEFGSISPVVAVELMTAGVFDRLAPPEIAATLSALLYDRFNEFRPDSVSHSVRDAVDIVTTVAGQVSQLETKHATPTDSADSVNAGLVHVAYRWAMGATLNEALSETDEDAGAVVKHLCRLADSCKEAKNAAHVLGNVQLARAFEMAGRLVRVGVVAASSLYIS